MATGANQHWRKGLAGAGLAALVLAPGAASAQTGPTAPDVKAAYLLKFGAFVDWPAGRIAEDAPLVLCIVGRDPVAAVITRQATGARAGTHPVTLRRLQKLTADAGCHIAYVAGSPEQPVADGLKAVAESPVLTVTDSDHGEARGMIHFAMQQSRVKFHIDQGAATRGALTLSSKLLALALSVKP
jgi:hypothetical protein